MEQKYDATYQFDRVIVHIVAPSPLTEEEKNQILREFCAAGWEDWNAIPEEERLKTNAEYDGG